MATKTYQIPTLAADEATTRQVAPSLYFRCMSSAGYFTIRLRTDSEQLAEISNWSAGLQVGPLPRPYTLVEIVNGSTSQAIEFVASDTPIEDNRLVGTVNITGGLLSKPQAADAWTVAAASVTNAAGGSLIIAANTNRARVTVQNTGAADIALGPGSTVTAANGLIILAAGGAAAGGSAEFHHKGAIWGIGTTAASGVRVEEETYT